VTLKYIIGTSGYTLDAASLLFGCIISYLLTIKFSSTPLPLRTYVLDRQDADFA
jgi:hypothetical protein